MGEMRSVALEKSRSGLGWRVGAADCGRGGSCQGGYG